MDSAVTFHLDHFTGPLELLLFLISKNKLEITDIPVALILDQYLAYLDTMPEMDMETASAFIIMAAQLIYIKTRILLPREADAEEEDPRQALVEMLLEYKRFKAAAGIFAPVLRRGQDLLTREPSPLERWTVDAYHHTPGDLSRALRLLRERERRKTLPKTDAFNGLVGAEPFPVETKVSAIVQLLRRQENLPLRDVYRRSRSRSELVAIFLAVLELMNTRKLTPPEDMRSEDLTLRFTTPEEQGDTVHG